jgi:hypothetical protein
VTVREWLEGRTPAAPATLTRQIVALLGSDADVDESRTAEVCLEAATRALEGLLSDGRFARESAVELLAIDALTTYAYEHASQAPATNARLDALTERGRQLFGQLMEQRV